MRGHMFTITTMGGSVSKIQRLTRGRIIINHDHTTRSIMSTFTRTSKLRQWYNLRCIADVICVDVSIINDRTRRIAQLVFKVCERNIKTFLANTTQNHTFPTRRTLGCTRVHGFASLWYITFTNNTCLLPEYTSIRRLNVFPRAARSVGRQNVGML